MAARRLSNQIGRAFRGTYGAETGLRTLAQATARQMLVAGAAPVAVARAFEDCVVGHPDRALNAPQDSVVGMARSATLVEVTRASVESVARELARPV